jgi:hypothetical protein
VLQKLTSAMLQNHIAKHNTITLIRETISIDIGIIFLLPVIYQVAQQIKLRLLYIFHTMGIISKTEKTNVLLREELL